MQCSGDKAAVPMIFRCGSKFHPGELGSDLELSSPETLIHEEELEHYSLETATQPPFNIHINSVAAQKCIMQPPVSARHLSDVLPAALALPASSNQDDPQVRFCSHQSRM